MNWRRHTDYRVYLVTDRELCLGRPLEDIVLAAVRGGAGAVQLREKHASSREFLELARALVSRIQPLGIPLIINDRADIALASGAAGLHVGQSDLPPEDARRLMGPDAIIGLSVETMEELKAELAGLVVKASEAVVAEVLTDEQRGRLAEIAAEKLEK